jgi:hypothetical protein
MIMLNKARIGIGIAAIGLAASMVPAVSASASVSRTAGIHAIQLVQKSSLCKSDEKLSAAAAKTEGGSALEKDIESGNFGAVKKLMLATFTSESSLEKAYNAYLSGAPKNVQSAASESLKFDGTIKSDIEKSNSMTQFESYIESAEKNPKLVAAEKVLSAYSEKKCG